MIKTHWTEFDKGKNSPNYYYYLGALEILQFMMRYVAASFAFHNTHQKQNDHKYNKDNKITKQFRDQAGSGLTNTYLETHSVH